MLDHEIVTRKASLPRGHCLFSFPESSERKRRRSRRGQTRGAPLSPILVREGRDLFLCKAANFPRPSAQDDDDDNDNADDRRGCILKWNLEVKVHVPSMCATTEPECDTESAVEMLLKDEVMVPTFTFTDSGGTSGQRWASLIPIAALQEVHIPVSVHVGTNFVAMFPEQPDVPLSVVFRARSVLSNQSLPLQLSCLKRQMVGLYVLYGEGTLTTNVTITFDDTSLDLCLESVSLQPGLSRPNVFVVTPSTRITILEFEEPMSELKSHGCDKSTLSDVTQMLLGTVRTMTEAKNVDIPRMFLLSGPAGAGKTYAVKMALQLTPTSIYAKFLHGSDIMASSSRESMTPGFVLEKHFKQLKTLSLDRICLVFLDECDALLSSPTATTMLAFQLDEIALEWTQIIVIAATNNIDSVPQHLKRPGRFEQVLILQPPCLAQRLEILEGLVGGETPELEDIAEMAIGFVPADLQALVRRAKLLGLGDSHSNLSVNLRKAIVHVGASALRDSALSAPPKATWNSIAGDAGGAKTALVQAIEWPRTKKEEFKRLGLAPPRGILLHGPPGCAKTTLARAAAGSESVSFLSLSPADVFSSSYVGEAEAKVRNAFANARAAAPCVLFFDEIDAILGSNADGDSHHMHRSGSGASAESRVLSTFLNETDGLTTTKGDRVLVIGATNRPSTLDAALLRPGRFDKLIYVPPPDYDGRKAIIESLLEQMGKLQDFSETELRQLANEDVSGKFTGAEIAGAVREAAARSLRESLSEGEKIPRGLQAADLENSLLEVKPLLMDSHILDEYAKFEQTRKLR